MGSKGTTSLGKMGGKGTHIRCRRCGRHSYHVRKKRCAACGFGEITKLRRYSWQNKKINRTRIV
ncbi:50S ribosomal protein L37e [Candidatus Bathyarchaeota archaeon]|nr:MAG: 50S ribosomal protein L37e [Candidatus Bathyarchaeota archaeon]